jgi:hypothetical protein
MTDNNAAIAAIAFALETDCGLEFLRCWNECDFNYQGRMVETTAHNACYVRSEQDYGSLR